MVNLSKNHRQFWNYILKIQWEIHFLTFLNTDKNAPKNCFKNWFWTAESARTRKQGDFFYKMWNKNSKTPRINLSKKLRQFPNYILKIQWEIHFLLFQILTKMLQKTALKTDFELRKVPELENMHFHFHAFSGWGTSWGPNSVFKAVL